MQYSNPACVWCCSVPCCCKAVLSHHRPRWVTLPTQPLPPQPLDILCAARGQQGWTHMQEHGQTRMHVLLDYKKTSTQTQMLQSERLYCNHKHMYPIRPTNYVDKYTFNVTLICYSWSFQQSSPVNGRCQHDQRWDMIISPSYMATCCHMTEILYCILT